VENSQQFPPTDPATPRDAAALAADKDRAVSLLARGVAHDFNNLFAAILSHLDLVAISPQCPTGLRGNIALAQEAARRGAELVGKLQTFSSEAELRLTRLDFVSQIKEVLPLLRRSIGAETQVRFLANDDAPCWIDADANQIMQLLFNLALAAKEASGGRREIVIRVDDAARRRSIERPEKSAGFVCLTVGDNESASARSIGAGADTTKNGGVGLSIADSISARHGGWLEAERQPGVGTQFRVYLPRAAAEQLRVATAQRTSAAARAAQSLDGTETILVVDDEPALRLLMRAVLGYRGYQVIEAESGEESLRRFAESPVPVSLVLMDVNLPGVSGWEAMVRLRSRNPHVPVVILSGGFADEERPRALSLGAAEFVSKPFTNESLVSIVRTVLDRAQA
jgi:CheY-like chemotaxis protein